MNSTPSPRLRSKALIVLLCIFAAFIAVYWIMRYGGWAMEGDAMRMTLSGEGILVEGQLAPQRYTYAAGHGYPALLAVLSYCTGASVQTLQLITAVWLVVFVLVAFVTYRELLGGTAVAVVGAFLLLLQPDFVFHVLRSSHEKATWLFGLLLLFLLVRSYRYVMLPARFAVHVLLFYLVFLAMVTSNTYFASTFLTALVLSFIGGSILLVWDRRGTQEQKGRGALQRLLIVSLACSVIVFTFINFLYPPAVELYRTLSHIGDRLSLLLLGAEQVTTRPYERVATAWRSTGIYLSLTAAQWLIVLCSLGAWLSRARHLVRKGDRSLSSGKRLLWLLYGGFAFQLAMGTVVDLAGALSANLQLRLFVPFSLLASPMAAPILLRGLRVLWRKDQRLRFAASWFIVILVCCLVVASLLKSTNDPSVGNLWIFYSPAELHAGQWSDRHLKNRSVWVDTFSHHQDVLEFRSGYAQERRNRYVLGKQDAPFSHVLISRLTRLQANRSSLALPGVVTHNCVYDNGEAQLYHRRPLTPYQR